MCSMIDSDFAIVIVRKSRSFLHLRADLASVFESRSALQGSFRAELRCVLGGLDICDRVFLFQKKIQREILIRRPLAAPDLT